MNLRTLSGALSGAGVLLVLVLQVLPWATMEIPATTVPGFSSPYYSMPSTTVGGGTASADTWGLEWEGGSGATADTGWYSDDMTDGDGDDTEVMLIRAAIPLLLAGGALALAGALVTLLTRGALGPVLGVVAALLLVVGTALFANGVDELFEGSDFAWVAGLYVAIAACAFATAGGVVGLVGRQAEPLRKGTTA